MCAYNKFYYHSDGMSTLYLRNVPDEVIKRLKSLAEREGMSVSAMVVKELSRSTRRSDNPALLGGLPDLGVDVDDIAAALDSGRGAR